MNRRTKYTSCSVSPKNNISGKKYGKLTAIKAVGKTKHRTVVWQCRCDCGDETFVVASQLISGHTKSCGCLTKKHGKFGTKAYQVWDSMIQRCTNKKHKSYKRYGGRGIDVCTRWHVFINFYKDMGDPPEGKQIDRKDNNVGYCLENCRWVSPKTNTNNRINNVSITYKGETKTISQWAELFGLNYFTLYSRVREQKWDIEKALTTPTGATTNNRDACGRFCRL